MAGRADEILPETRGWDEAAQVTRGQRSKEGLADYRYFPEPDLPPLHITPQYLQSVQVFPRDPKRPSSHSAPHPAQC